MLALTTATTFVSGLFLSGEHASTMAWLLEAFTFPAALLSILLAHELGHFLACYRYGLDATLPLFIPGPPFPIGVGTFGAFIRIRSPIHQRRQLLEVGAAGPLAGMLLAIPLTVLGLMHSRVVTAAPSALDLQFGESLLFYGLRVLVVGATAPDQAVLLHPIALAGWLGLFVTSLNLIPAGQLDGGHILQALFGRRQRWISRGVFLILVWWGVFGGLQFKSWWQVPLVVALAGWALVLCSRPSRRKLDRNIFLALLAGYILMEIQLEINSGSSVWLVWGLLVYLFGLDHPPVRDAEQPLNAWRRAVGLVCLLVFIGTFLPLPIQVTP